MQFLIILGFIGIIFIIIKKNKNQLPMRVNSYFPIQIKTVFIYFCMKTAAYLSMIFI